MEKLLFLLLLPILLIPVYAQEYSDNTPTVTITVSTEQEIYQNGDIIVISGHVTTIIGNTPMTLQIFSEGDLVEIIQSTIAQDGTYSHAILAEGALWEESGVYEVHAQYGAQKVSYSFIFSGGTGHYSEKDILNLIIQPDPSQPKIDELEQKLKN